MWSRLTSSAQAIAEANKTLINVDDPDRGCVEIHSGPAIVVSWDLGFESIGFREYILYGELYSSLLGHIHCSEDSARILKLQCPDIDLKPRGKTTIKGEGTR